MPPLLVAHSRVCLSYHENLSDLIWARDNATDNFSSYAIQTYAAASRIIAICKWFIIAYLLIVTWNLYYDTVKKAGLWSWHENLNWVCCCSTWSGLRMKNNGWNLPLCSCAYVSWVCRCRHFFLGRDVWAEMRHTHENWEPRSVRSLGFPSELMPQNLCTSTSHFLMKGNILFSGKRQIGLN